MNKKHTIEKGDLLLWDNGFGPRLFYVVDIQPGLHGMDTILHRLTEPPNPLSRPGPGAGHRLHVDTESLANVYNRMSHPIRLIKGQR